MEFVAEISSSNNNNLPASTEHTRSDLFENVICSDRLKKDVENLMNSSFWIDALKKSRAFGIGSNLYCNFAHCSVGIFKSSRFLIKNMILLLFY